MSMTILNSPADNSYQASVYLNDSGTVLNVAGCLNPSGINGLTSIAFTGSPLTAPAAPASGSIYWLVEVNTTTGALDVLQSTVSLPVNSAGCITIFQQTLSTGQTDPALVPTSTTPDV